MPEGPQRSLAGFLRFLNTGVDGPYAREQDCAMDTKDALLKQVSIKAQDSTLVATFDLDGTIPGSGAYVVGLVAASPDYSSQRRLGIEFMNGEPIAFYSFSHEQSTEENYDLSGVTHSENSITGHFPLAAINGLGKSHVMTGFSEADGREFQSGVPVEEAL
jgi:hypothetical protein